jgi:protein-disulfide isomerase
LQVDRHNQRDFLLGFLAIFSLSSLLLNAVLIVHISRPSLWRDLMLSHLHPPEVRPTDHVRGNSNATITVIEYSDFQCPFCKQMHGTLKTAVNEGKIRWVFRDYPLKSIHPLAVKEAEAAQCAGAQGKFWEYADALYDAQDQISASGDFDQQLASLAQGIHANPLTFKQCLDSGKFNELLRNEMTEAESLQIDSTPTTFVGNRRLGGSVSYEEFERKWLTDFVQK